MYKIHLLNRRDIAIQKKHVFKRESPTSGQKYTVLDLLRKIDERAKTYGTIHISEKLFMDEEYYNYNLLVFVDIHVSESTWGVQYSSLRNKKMCPVIRHLPFGFLLVMPKCKLISMEDWNQFDYCDFIKDKDITIPVEEKRDSFGYYNDKIVAIDYGS